MISRPSIFSCRFHMVTSTMTSRMPQFLRIVLVLGIVLLAVGGGLYAYRYISEPTTLTVAAGSFDGEAAGLMSAIAARLASTNSHIRLKVVDSGAAPGASKAFS